MTTTGRIEKKSIGTVALDVFLKGNGTPAIVTIIISCFLWRFGIQLGSSLGYIVLYIVIHGLFNYINDVRTEYNNQNAEFSTGMSDNGSE